MYDQKVIWLLLKTRFIELYLQQWRWILQKMFLIKKDLHNLTRGFLSTHQSYHFFLIWLSVPCYLLYVLHSFTTHSARDLHWFNFFRWPFAPIHCVFSLDFQGTFIRLPPRTTANTHETFTSEFSRNENMKRMIGLVRRQFRKEKLKERNVHRNYSGHMLYINCSDIFLSTCKFFLLCSF